jgi:Mn2+/Fe2+ NRAMP family transporter
MEKLPQFTSIDNLPWEHDEWTTPFIAGCMALIVPIIIIVALCIRTFDNIMLITLSISGTLLLSLSIGLFYFSYKLLKLPKELIQNTNTKTNIPNVYLKEFEDKK